MLNMSLQSLVNFTIGCAVGVILLILCVYVFLGIKGCQAVKERGAKDIIMQVWDGPENGSTNTTDSGK